MASMDKSIRREKNQNIQVFVRLRPLNNRERHIRSQSVVEVVNDREVVVRQSHQSQHTKKFTFDRAFGPNAQQVEVYKEVVSPLIQEVLAGYNCTVFAYGQTGTGKTHTMVGESTGDDVPWQSDPLSGIIPRALSQLFDELRITNTEYNVRVSYLELYNEELSDLLSPSMDNSKLRIYEDVNRKGSTIVNGLEEITVYNKNEVYDIMARGQERKKVASTLMNSQSSRSHTVFTIVVHIKENSPKGEELVKIGKLNLVDLAGSENISKAGSDNPGKKERARECVNINQSLLTLGRVITALVEKHPHIPYRESKLTRILQESLGGRTKTSIIATISPGHKDLEETMSTLEYANRAKNIQNKPEVNQKLTKQAILKEFAEEVDKLKRELTASREKNGVYLPTEMYEEMTVKQDEQRREIQELLLKKRAMEEERERMETVFRELEAMQIRTQDDLLAARAQLDHTVTRLQETSQRCEEQKHLVVRHVSTESALTAQAQQLMQCAQLAASDAGSLHDTVDRRRSLESNNHHLVCTYRDASTTQRQRMLTTLQHLRERYMNDRQHLQATIDDQARDTSMTQEMNIQDLKLLMAKLAWSLNEIKSLTSNTQIQLDEASAACNTALQQSCVARRGQLQQLLDSLTDQLVECVHRARSTDVVGVVGRSTEEWLSGASNRVSCLQRAHSSFSCRNTQQHAQRNAATTRRHQAMLQALQDREQAVTASIQQLEEDKKKIEEDMCRQLELIEREHRESDRRLRDLITNMENMRKSQQENVQRRMNGIQQEMCIYSESTSKHIAQDRAELEAIQRAKEAAINDLGECEQEEKGSMDIVKEYDTQFGEDVSAISAEMESFSACVVHIVQHSVQQLLDQLTHAETTVKQTAAEISEAEATSSKQYECESKAAIDSVVSTASDAMTQIVNNTEETTNSSVSTLSTITERCSRLSTNCLQQQSAATVSLTHATDAVTSAAERMRQDIDVHADMEGRYLMQEYRVYCPTGNTPERREYRYPRRLAATSPHEHILARLRQREIPQPHTPDHNELIEVDTSDSDEVSESSVSGVSEDSGVAQQ